MGSAADSRAGELAGLASALTAACTRLDAVADTAARAAAELVGDCGGLRLVRGNAWDDALAVYHHRDIEKERVLTDARASGGSGGGGVAALPDNQPRVLQGLGREQFQQLAPQQYWPIFDRVGIGDGLVCPVVVEGTLMGCLELFRTTGGPGYTDLDLDLAGEIAAQVGVALGTAHTMQRLRESEQRYRNIVETTHEGVWLFDSAGVTTYVNDRMAELLGSTPQDLIGMPAHGFLDNPGQARLTARLAAPADAAGEVYECRLLRAIGSPIWVQISAAHAHGADGGATGTLFMVTDISDRVTARDMRRQLDQLRRIDSLGQLAGGIAHDFNNLLTVISGSAEVLAEEIGPDSGAHELAEQIVRAAARGSELTHQLLAFGRRSPHAQTVSIPELLTGARELLGRALGEHVRLDILAGPGLWPVHADRGQLEQALANLAVNARDAMDHGGVLTIEATNADVDAGQLDNPDAAGRFVRLAVSDTGTGMAPETRERAFEPFFTTRAARGAAGLGLSTVHGIVQASGGHIRLYSEPGLGTTVNLFLPAADEQVAPVAPPEQEKPGRHGRILVVEDQPELAQLTNYLLQPAGYTVTVVTDPAAAIAHLHSGLYPDLLLTDVVMPGMSGPALAKALRARRPGLKVLYMSGYTAGVLNPRGHLDEDSVLIQKPFNRETLLAAVARALAG